MNKARLQSSIETNLFTTMMIEEENVEHSTSSPSVNLTESPEQAKTKESDKLSKSNSRKPSSFSSSPDRKKRRDSEPRDREVYRRSRLTFAKNNVKDHLTDSQRENDKDVLLSRLNYFAFET